LVLQMALWERAACKRWKLHVAEHDTRASGGGMRNGGVLVCCANVQHWMLSLCLTLQQRQEHQPEEKLCLSHATEGHQQGKHQTQTNSSNGGKPQQEARRTRRRGGNGGEGNGNGEGHDN
jgi:hypothetical protein